MLWREKNWIFKNILIVEMKLLKLMNHVSKLPRYYGTLMAQVNLVEREKENKWGYHSTLAVLTLIILFV
jgi:hypothetical protein